MFNRAVRCPASHRVPCRHRPVSASLTVRLPRKLWVLKETASTVAALKLGKQTILLRKGGIREPRFLVPVVEFLIQPTAFHLDAELIRPEYREIYTAGPKNRVEDEVDLKVLTHVTGVWRTRDPNIATALGPLHIWSDHYMTRRLSWRPNMDLTLLEVRCYELQRALSLHLEPEQKGCFSWFSLTNTDTSDRPAVPCIQQEAFDATGVKLREALEALDVTEEDVHLLDDVASQNANVNETMSLVSITLFKVQLDTVAPRSKDSLFVKMYIRGTYRGLEVPVSDYQNGDYIFTAATMVLESGVAQSSEICIKIIQNGKFGKLTNKTIGKIAFRVSPTSSPITDLRPNELTLNGKTVGRVTAQIVFLNRVENIASQTDQNATLNNERPTLMQAITSSTMTSDAFPSPPPSEVSSESSAPTNRSRQSGCLIVGQPNNTFTPVDIRTMYEQLVNERQAGNEAGYRMPPQHSSVSPSTNHSGPQRINTQSSTQFAQSNNFPLSPTISPPAYGRLPQHAIPGATGDQQHLLSQNSAPASATNIPNDATYFPPINNIARQGQSDAHVYCSHGYAPMS